MFILQFSLVLKIKSYRILNSECARNEHERVVGFVEIIGVLYVFPS